MAFTIGRYIQNALSSWRAQEAIQPLQDADATISTVFRERVSRVYTGIQAGASSFFTGWALEAIVLSKLPQPEDTDFTNETFINWMNFWTETPLRDFLHSNFILPIGEEFVFRVVIQGGIRYVVGKVLPDKPINILKCVKLSQSDAVSIIASSILFGSFHYSQGGVPLVISAGVGGLIYGVAQAKAGFLGSGTAHMTHNLLIDVADAIL